MLHCSYQVRRRKCINCSGVCRTETREIDTRVHQLRGLLLGGIKGRNRKRCGTISAPKIALAHLAEGEGYRNVQRIRGPSIMRFLKASREAIGLLCLCRCPGEITTELGQGIISPQATVQEENIVSSLSGQCIFIEYSRLRGYNCLRLRTQSGPKAVAGRTD
ncbi:hypothetical protein BDV24DRAFT_143356 [Aspergillus arachidicola]|uniref:Uncharacterized protein n=1 Tax=Aspergillus arachidicola TaxID=656916 RepID=A0A5N6XTD9_9EURO|nr:hypothetical protein BDV24DRAFT_143356 [Aspergillus arachidicola]